MNEDEVVEELREERVEYGRLWREAARGERDAYEWINEGADYWEETHMLAELKSEIDEARGEPTQIIKALRAGRISPVEAEALRMKLNSKRSDLEQSLKCIHVPDIRKYHAEEMRELMSYG